MRIDGHDESSDRHDQCCGSSPLAPDPRHHRPPRSGPEDGAALDARVRAIFEDLRKRYPDTPLVLLSPLAEGADRLAARVALDCGARLIVPLPMSQATYERDFQTPSSVVEFRELLCRADRSFELAWAGLDAEGTSGVSGGDRDRAYALVGAYIAHHCQILIALWDGEDSDREGGTAQVVRFKREGIPDCYAIHVKRSAEPGALTCSLIEPAEFGPVYHVVTPRVGNPNPTRNISAPYRPLFLDKLLSMLQSKSRTCNISAPYSPLFPADVRGEDAVREAYNRIFARIDTFNSDWIGLAAELSAKREAGKADLLPDGEEGPLPAPLESIRERFALADALAATTSPGARHIEGPLPAGLPRGVGVRPLRARGTASTVGDASCLSHSARSGVRLVLDRDTAV